MTILTNSSSGRGVFSSHHFQKGDFLVEYRGEVITKDEYQRRHKLYHKALDVFLFEFRFNGKQLWVDAAREDGSLGRLVNDEHVNPNSKMHIITVDRKPHLCLFAKKDIIPGEEITYNYGDSDWPWRGKVSAESEQQSAGSVNCAGVEDGTQEVHNKEQIGNTENVTGPGEDQCTQSSNISSSSSNGRTQRGEDSDAEETDPPTITEIGKNTYTYKCQSLIFCFCPKILLVIDKCIYCPFIYARVRFETSV
ncbi:putative variant-silencing SET domain-containing protein-like [Triplophysa rosa]|uniref:Variant-silencing SET domain-containing protein-like n=1 Tax=Triplophysa rosa TaxID=992332 RepID=A0A9W7W7C8_TRIRA|nr:putative variant-silencing SET domain-containing protein-like [Triplophysa rosa]